MFMIGLISIPAVKLYWKSSMIQRMILFIKSSFIIRREEETKEEGTKILSRYLACKQRSYRTMRIVRAMSDLKP